MHIRYIGGIDSLGHVNKFSVVLPALLPIANVSAHGNVVEVAQETAGPYEIVITILSERPVVGTIHSSITPLDKSNGELVTTPRSCSSPVTRQAIPSTGFVSPPDTPHFYDANIKFKSPGTWTMEIPPGERVHW